MARKTTGLYVNTFAEYHGSRRMYHGIVFRIIGREGDRRTLAYATDEEFREPVLRNARISSLTPVDARTFWKSFKRCSVCTIDYRGDECPVCNPGSGRLLDEPCRKCFPDG